MNNLQDVGVVYRDLVPAFGESVIEKTPGTAVEIVFGWTPSCRLFVRTAGGTEREILGDRRDGALFIAAFDELRVQFDGTSAQRFRDRLTLAIYQNRSRAIVSTDSLGAPGQVADLSRILIQNVAAGGAFTLWDDAVNSTSGTAPNDEFRIFSPNGLRDRRALWLGGFVHAQGQAAALTVAGQLWLLAYNDATLPATNDQPYPIAVLPLKTAILPAAVKASAAPGAVEHWWKPEHSEGVNQANYGIRWPIGGGKLVYYNADTVNASIIRSQIALMTY